jgi:hypothetical protein
VAIVDVEQPLVGVGEAACPRRWSSDDPLQLDVPPKPWHNRRDGLGVLEPEDVTRARRISPGPHPQSPSAYANTSRQPTLFNTVGARTPAPRPR